MKGGREEKEREKESGRMDRWKVVWMDGWMGGRKEREGGRWMSGWTHEWMDGWMVNARMEDR